MNENKKNYVKPVAEKLDFDYTNTVSASSGQKNPAQCNGVNPGHGCGGPHDDLGNNSPGNCHTEGPRKQPFQCAG